jgi:hypothetical protein
MYKIKKGYSLARLFAVVSASLILLTGVTFALFQSNKVTLQGSTISSATAHLLLSSNGTTFSDVIPGFNFANIQPGGAPMPQPGFDVYIKNDGTSPLMLAASMATNLFNPSAARLDKIHLALTPDDEPTTTMSLSSLYNAYSNGDTVHLATGVAPGQTRHFYVQVQMDSSVVASTESSVSLSNINVQLVGEAPNS